MKISADALMLSISWAKMFQPWMWNSSSRVWTQKGRQHPLLVCNQEQLQYALNKGWTPDGIRAKLSAAKREKIVVTHVYPLLCQQACVILDSDGGENFLTGREEYFHPVLFSRNGLLKASFSLQDVLAHAKPLLSNDQPTRRALRILIAEWGLDKVLYAVDRAKIDEIVLRSPWGISIFMDDAEERLNTKRRLREQTKYEVQILETIRDRNPAHCASS